MRNLSAKEADFDARVLKIAAAIDKFEGYRHQHAARSAVLSEAVAQTFYLAAHDLFALRQAALVHDIGEFVMNREYIETNQILSADERFDMQRHPVIGEQEAAKRGLSRAVQLIVRWHHEWWNGFGYPDALRREQIPLAARILRVADTFSALTDDRPYRMAVSPVEAKRYLSQWAGIEFDPRVVKAFLSLKDLKELESPSEQWRTAE
jgi:putative nucleotidyltransferase with HDIG domain